MRIAHYYARYLTHPSGVTSSIESWATVIGKSSDRGLAVQDIVAARVAPHGRTHFSSRTRTPPHFGWSRRTWIPLTAMHWIRSYDLIYIHEGWTISNLVVALCARLLGKPVVLMPHGAYAAEIVNHLRLRAFQISIERCTLSLVSAVHFFYDSEASEAFTLLRVDRPYWAIPNGAPMVPADERWSGDSNYWVWLGRFSVYHKGLDRLIARWSELDSPQPMLRLIGPDYFGGKRHVQELVDRYGVRDVVSIEPAIIDTSQIYRILSAARGYLHPSRWESCSITLLESLAVGTPTVVSSAIHAAPKLSDLGVIREVDFSKPNGDFLPTIRDSTDSERLSQMSQEWAAGRGSWDGVGMICDEHVRRLVEGDNRDRTR